MDGLVDFGEGDAVGAEAALGLGKGAQDEVPGLLPEAEEGVALHELHEGGGLSLLWRGALAHLLAGRHDAARLLAADAQVDGDAQSADVDAPCFAEDVEIKAGEARRHLVHCLLRGDGLVEVRGVALGTGLERDAGQGHANSPE